MRPWNLLTLILIVFGVKMTETVTAPCDSTRCGCYESYCWAYLHSTHIDRGDWWCFTQVTGTVGKQDRWKNCTRHTDCHWGQTCGNCRQYKGFKETLRISCENIPTIEDELLTWTNRARAKGRFCGGIYYPAAKPLVWNARLAEAASAHSTVLHQSKSLYHSTDIGGSTCVVKGENIARSQNTSATVVKAWLRERGFCENLMHTVYNNVGAANVGHFWTQIFGGRCH